MDLSVYDTLDKCSAKTLKTLEDRIKIQIDKLTTKELLGGDLVQFFLSLILNPAVTRSPSGGATGKGVQDEVQKRSEKGVEPRRVPIFQKEGRRDLAAALFEGSEALLSTQYGVRALSALCGYWSAKERKSFLASMKKVMVLSQTNWMHYLCNAVDGVFVARLLATLDDTKLAKEALLSPMFESEDNLNQLLNGSAKTTAFLLYVINPEEAAQYLRQVEIEQINFPSVTSKKDPAKRRTELAEWFHQQTAIKKKIAARIKADNTTDPATNVEPGYKALTKVHQDILEKLFAL